MLYKTTLSVIFAFRLHLIFILMQTLQELNLQSNDIGENGAEDLYNALRDNTVIFWASLLLLFNQYFFTQTLTKLYLTGNKNAQCDVLETIICIKKKKVI